MRHPGVAAPRIELEGQVLAGVSNRTSRKIASPLQLIGDDLFKCRGTHAHILSQGFPSLDVPRDHALWVARANGTGKARPGGQHYGGFHCSI